MQRNTGLPFIFPLFHIFSPTRIAGLLQPVLSGEPVRSWKCLTQSTPREGGVHFLALLCR